MAVVHVVQVSCILRVGYSGGGKKGQCGEICKHQGVILFFRGEHGSGG